VVDLRGRVWLVSDRPGRVGRTKGALLVVDDLFGVPGGAGGLQQRVRVRLADDRRVCGQPLDSLVSGGDAVPAAASLSVRSGISSAAPVS